MSVLILGATSRIAQQIAHCYAAKGEAIAVAARDLEECRRIASDIEIRHEVRVEALAFDAVDLESHAALIEQAVDAVGPLSVAVLAFGDMGPEGFDPADPAQLRAVIDINFTGAASLCEQLAVHMTGQGRGSIVGITSVAGDRGRASNYPYGSAKGAFALYLQGLRNRVFSEGVHVMTVKLGFVDTRMTFGLQTAIPIASPEATAAAVVRAQGRKTESLYYPRFWGGIMGIIRAIPETLFKRLSL